ncbi:MerR family transcriptional regulator [Paraglaciecola marina]|uniref:MerR family transcriptional regulator n=1 Tax=Paraglaciecola marina TaxID=2500157 RepID=UPI00105CE081|nr:MerR family transcriptional regulator [Paraglaciecola marina]
MFIGRVSELTGASRKAIRHYESIGLINAPKRSGSYRTYDEHDVTVIAMIRKAQTLGFSLAELKEVVSQKIANKALPFDLINTVIDSKVSVLNTQAMELIEQAKQLEKFKIELSKSLP